jgi:hypothetical protein
VGFFSYSRQMLGWYIILVGKSDGKKPWRRWEDNIKMDIEDKNTGDLDWIHLDQCRDHWRTVGNTAVDLRVP